MRIWKSNPLFNLINSYLVDSPQPSNISYLWNFGSLLGFCLIIQIVTGVTLAMHYNAGYYYYDYPFLITCLLSNLLISVLLSIYLYMLIAIGSYKINNILVLILNILGLLLLCVVILLTFHFLYLVLFSKVMFCESFFDQMTNGTIERTPLLQPGQTIKSLGHGVYNVTGGQISVGNVGSGSITKIIGIYVEGSPINLAHNIGLCFYSEGNQPFNLNFAKVLFEIKAAGQQDASVLTLGKIGCTVQPDFGFYRLYLNSFRLSKGFAPQNLQQTSLTQKLLNGLSEIDQ